MAKKNMSIALCAPVSILAAEADGEGKPKGPPKFQSTFYTGGALSIDGWDHPVIVDLEGLVPGNVLVANLDHDRTKRVGNFQVVNDKKELVAVGTATAKTAARDEVVGSALEGYVWQSSIEVVPKLVEEVRANKKVSVNGREFTGPAFVAREGVLKGFAFVSHGADDNTVVTIAASAVSKEKKMIIKAEVRAWAEKMGLDVDAATPEQLDSIQANYEGHQGTKPKAIKGENPFESHKQEASRRDAIRGTAEKFIEPRKDDLEYINAVEEMANHAIEAGMSVLDFRAAMYEASVPLAHTMPSPRGRSKGLDNRVLMAAVCQSGRLPNVDKEFTDQELQAAHDLYPHGISLNELILAGAQANGFRGNSTRVSIEAQRAAFRMGGGPMQVIHGQGWSTIEVSSIVSNVANKFLRIGWNSVDMTPMEMASVRPVRDFKQTTTVSLTGAMQFEKLGKGGEIKHGTLGEVVYNNKADTYAAMLAITREDIINDDLGALTAAPQKLGRGGALKLNDIFWTAFLAGESTSFFSASHTNPTGGSNLNTGAADMTIAGLTATELLFLNQVDPDGKPLGIMPSIILVPNALKATAIALMDPQSKLITGASSTLPDTNVFRGRFRVLSSPYLHNTSYTGYSASAWYMLAAPADLPCIEIVALNGRVEPIIDTADADFNVLGIQLRGYSDVGVALQEYRAAVKADGGSS